MPVSLYDNALSIHLAKAVCWGRQPVINTGLLQTGFDWLVGKGERGRGGGRSIYPWLRYNFKTPIFFTDNMRNKSAFLMCLLSKLALFYSYCNISHDILQTHSMNLRNISRQNTLQKYWIFYRLLLSIYFTPKNA